jgi:hypothetical protein
MCGGGDSLARGQPPVRTKRLLRRTPRRTGHQQRPLYGQKHADGHYVADECLHRSKPYMAAGTQFPTGPRAVGLRMGRRATRVWRGRARCHPVCLRLVDQDRFRLPGLVSHFVCG